jgi:hypothetical protein
MLIRSNSVSVQWAGLGPELLLRLDRRASEPLRVQLESEVREAIRAGRRAAAVIARAGAGARRLARVGARGLRAAPGRGLSHEPRRLRHEGGGCRACAASARGAGCAAAALRGEFSPRHPRSGQLSGSPLDLGVNLGLDDGSSMAGPGRLDRCSAEPKPGSSGTKLAAARNPARPVALAAAA